MLSRETESPTLRDVIRQDLSRMHDAMSKTETEALAASAFHSQGLDEATAAGSFIWGPLGLK